MSPGQACRQKWALPPRVMLLQLPARCVRLLPPQDWVPVTAKLGCGERGSGSTEAAIERGQGTSRGPLPRGLDFSQDLWLGARGLCV